MRTAEVELAGKKRVLCFTTRARMALVERFGGLNEMGVALTGEDIQDKTEAILDAAVILMDAGARNAQESLQDVPEPLTKEQLYDLTSAEELAQLQVAVFDAITAGQWRTVGAEPPKNAQTTPGEAT